MKMYILVKEGLKPGHVAVATAHAALATYLQFEAHPDTQTWIGATFYKTVCQVSEQEFEKAKATEDHVVITESRLDNQEVAIGFRPREEWPKGFRFFKLYK